MRVQEISRQCFNDPNRQILGDVELQNRNLFVLDATFFLGALAQPQVSLQSPM
jgi:hypothetical protein